MKTVTLKMTDELKEVITRLAEEKQVPVSTLIRMWVAERAKKEDLLLKAKPVQPPA